MATRQAKITVGNNGAVTVFWEGLLQGDDGNFVDVSGYTDMTVHSDGNYSGSGSITMQGSNNAVAVFSLTEPGNTAISLTADTVGSLIVEQPIYMRPLVASGDGSTDIDVWISAKWARG